MRSIILSAVVLASMILSARADISLPKKDTFYDKFGRGFSNVAQAPTEIMDSFYMSLQEEGPTYACSKGFVQGIGRAVSDIALGTFDLVTAPLPIGPDWSYRTWKQPPHGMMVVNEYPPADLVTDWY